MEFKVIFFSMAATLVALFIFTHFYRKKENVLTKLEANYSLKVSAYRKNPSSSELREDALNAAQEYAKARNLSHKALEKMIQQDLPLQS